MFMQRLAALVPRPRPLKRLFDLDIERCPQCGGDVKIIATFKEPEVVAKILTHPGLSARAAPHAPAQRLELFEGAGPSSRQRFCNSADDPAQSELARSGQSASV